MEIWQYDQCYRAWHMANALQMLVNEGATVLVAIANLEEPDMPCMVESVVAGPALHKDRCYAQHGISLPPVTGIKLDPGHQARAIG